MQTEPVQVPAIYALSLTLFRWFGPSIINVEKSIRIDLPFELNRVFPFIKRVHYSWSRPEITRPFAEVYTRSMEVQCFLNHIKPGDIIPIHYKPQKFYNDDQPVYLVMVTVRHRGREFFPLGLHSIMHAPWPRIGSWQSYIAKRFSLERLVTTQRLHWSINIHKI